ncbi:MAG TPA: SoxR reducing system RseC family protein [Salinivirgaceae bacterium]|nr:SoxR reducing system RseC family protein [Salinivirgaceae bacterium]
MRDKTMEIIIQPSSACVSCQVKGYCSSAESSQKILTIPRQAEFAVGDDVVVRITESQGYKALLYAYGIPILILLTGLFWGNYNSLPEWETAIISFILLAAYFFSIYRWGKKLTKSFEFQIEKIKP